MIYPRRVLTLAIEATNPNIPTPGVLLARDGRVLAEKALVSQGRHDDLLLPAISDVLGECGATPRDLDDILVSIGPGGFTATRLACVAAAMLAEVGGARVLAVPTAVVGWRSSLTDKEEARSVVVALASKGEQAFITCFGGDNAHARQLGRSIGADAFRAMLTHHDVLLDDGRLPDSFETAATESGVTRAALRLSASGLLASREFASLVDAGDLRPIYPREPDAVTQWRARHGRAPGDS